MPKCCEFMKDLSPKEVAMINNKARVFMCSSVEEGFGLPGLEAMACGCALASSEYCGVLEYAVDGKNALLSPVKNPEKMADNIIKLFENTALYQRIVREGIETAKQRSLEIAGDKFEKTLINSM